MNTYWKAWRYLIYLKKRKCKTLEDILYIQWSTENSRLATYTIDDWDTAHYRIYTLHILPLSGIHEQKINQGLYKPFTHAHMSKHKPTHIQDLTLFLCIHGICFCSMLWWKTLSIEYKKHWKQGKQKSRNCACGGKGDNALYDFSLFIVFPGILLPQICIHIPDLSPGVWFLACALLQKHIISSGGDGMVNWTKDHIVTFLIRILEAVQTRVKLQRIHKTWSCGEQSNQI